MKGLFAVEQHAVFLQHRRIPIARDAETLIHRSSHDRTAAIVAFTIDIGGKLVFAKDRSQLSGGRVRASVDLSRLGRLAIAAVVRMSGGLTHVTISLSNQELIDHLFSGTKQSSEQSTFKLVHRDTLPNGFLNQGRQHHS